MSTHVHVRMYSGAGRGIYMQTCFPSPFALDHQEPDDVIVARRCSGKALEKTSRGDIIGFAGDTVREPPLYQLCTASSPCSS